MKIIKVSFAIIIFTIFAVSTIFAQQESVRKSHFNLNRGIAIKGFDPVTFFTKDAAIRANGTISHTYNGVKYFFSSSNSLNQFKTTPSKFEPQYGGWCAYNMSMDGKKIVSSPEYYVIKKGKLYFFDSQVSKEKWQKVEDIKNEADNYWSQLFK